MSMPRKCPLLRDFTLTAPLLIVICKKCSWLLLFCCLCYIGRALRSGCRISLKSPTCNQWLACRNTECSSSAADCPAARFQIKRALGNGRILTGDFVFFNYNYGGSSLFSMTNGVGQKSNCPVAIGECTWYKCSNEVFQIYAKGKGIGEAIMNEDIVALYHSSVSRNGFVQFLSNRVGLSQCPLQMSGYVRPPSEAAFNYCEGDSAEIKIYD